MSPSPQARVALGTMLVVAACSSGQRPEHIAVGAQALSATNLGGTSLPAKTLSLTFDDGPYVHTAEMSTYLKSQGIRATFFLNGGYIAATTLPNPGALKLIANPNAVLAQLAADGHLVANHTTTHRDLVNEVLPTGAANVIAELAETDADIAPYVQYNRFLFRASYGSFDHNVFDALSGSPMNKYVGTVAWEMGGDVASYPAKAADWACWRNGLVGPGGVKFSVSSTECGDAYLNEISAVGRGIVLMHDSAEAVDGSVSTLAMVKYIVPILKARGYTFVRVDEVPDILALLPPAPCGPSCDDGDACTADRCDVALGCVHTHIQGCSDAGAKDAGLGDGGHADAGLDASTSPPRDDASPAPPIGSDGSTALPEEPDGASADPGSSCGVTRAPRHGAGGTLAVGLLAALFLRRRRTAR